MAIFNFHRKYMKLVFTSDELAEYNRFKKEVRRAKKQTRNKNYLDPNNSIVDRRYMVDPLKHLESYRAAKEGIEKPMPFGVDKTEAIKVMSMYGDKDLERTKRTKQQLFRMVEN